MTTIVPLIGKQRASVKHATAQVNIWEGSVRSSKTVCSLIAWIAYTRTGPAGNLVMIGKTERTLKRNIIDPLIDMLGPKRCRYIQGNGELWLLGRRIYIAGANDEKAQDKIRGLTLAGAYVDEASLMPESMWAMLMTRLSVDGAQVFATSNPDNPNHWLMRDWLRRASLWIKHDGSIVRFDDHDGQPALDLHRFSFRLADNRSLPARFVDGLKKQFVGLWRLRFIEGLWVLAEGAIFDTFDPSPGAGHVIGDADMPVIREWVVAIDYGTTNPFVALLIGLGADDCLYVVREWRWDSKKKHRSMTDAEYSAALRGWLDELDPPTNADVTRQCPGAREPVNVIVDPSAASFIAQLWRDGWFGVRGADNAVVDGIRSVSSLISAGRLKIHESCKGLIAEQTSYVWDTEAAKRGDEKPVKVDDHGPDAERYGVMGTRRWWRHWLAAPLADDEAA